jgi:UDP-N-acetylmuramate dehydrogenase
VDANKADSMIKDSCNYNLLRHNTFGMNVKCARFLEFSTIDDLREITSQRDIVDKPMLILGGGSNVLFVGDFPGTILHSGIKGIELIRDEDTACLRCGSGEVWDDVVDYAVSTGLYGAENLSAIPGEVGASAVQNIGAYGSEVKDLIVNVEAVDVMTGETCEFSPVDCCYGYRDSKFKHEWKNRYIITYVTYRFSKKFEPKLDYGNIKSFLSSNGIDNPTARCLRDAIISIRNAKLPDPGILGNAGSFFVNPIISMEKYSALSAEYQNMPHYILDDGRVKVPAGWLIEQCGWKGRSLGNAGVYERQSLVLVNRGGATGEEILALCERICSDVNKRFGIEIFPEVNIIR